MSLQGEILWFSLFCYLEQNAFFYLLEHALLDPCAPLSVSLETKEASIRSSSLLPFGPLHLFKRGCVAKIELAAFANT